jgi:alanine dehydrogenase
MVKLQTLKKGAHMQGAVAYTTTIALTNVTLPFILKIAHNGWQQACNLYKSVFKD